MLYARDGRWVKADKTFRRAIELEPGNSQAFNDLSDWLVWLGRMEQAVWQARLAE